MGQLDTYQNSDRYHINNNTNNNNIKSNLPSVDELEKIYTETKNSEHNTIFKKTVNEISNKLKEEAKIFKQFKKFILFQDFLEKNELVIISNDKFLGKSIENDLKTMFQQDCRYKVNSIIYMPNTEDIESTKLFIDVSWN